MNDFLYSSQQTHRPSLASPRICESMHLDYTPRARSHAFGSDDDVSSGLENICFGEGSSYCKPSFMGGSPSAAMVPSGNEGSQFCNSGSPCYYHNDNRSGQCSPGFSSHELFGYSNYSNKIYSDNRRILNKNIPIIPADSGEFFDETDYSFQLPSFPEQNQYRSYRRATYDESFNPMNSCRGGKSTRENRFNSEIIQPSQFPPVEPLKPLLSYLPTVNSEYSNPPNSLYRHSGTYNLCSGVPEYAINNAINYSSDPTDSDFSHLFIQSDNLISDYHMESSDGVRMRQEMSDGILAVSERFRSPGRQSCFNGTSEVHWPTNDLNQERSFPTDVTVNGHRSPSQLYTPSPYSPIVNDRITALDSAKPAIMDNQSKNPKHANKSKCRKNTHKKCINDEKKEESKIFDPDDIDPTINPRVFSGKKAKKNADYTQFMIDLKKVRSGEDTRLTVMLKNVPNNFTQDLVIQVLNIYVPNEFDFFYMPVDFKTNCNLGFGYVSMISTQSVVKIFECLNRKKWPNTPSYKVCEVSYARMQGKRDMQSLCKDWAIMQLPEKYRPVFFERIVENVNGIEVLTMRRQ